MPTYEYEQCKCTSEDLKEFDEKYPDATHFDTFEMNMPIDKRDTLSCGVCGAKIKRKISFTGLTWAPTAGGMR